MYRRTSVSPFSLRHVKRLQGRRGQFLLCQYTVQVDCFWQDLSTFGAFTSVLQHQTHGFADADYHSGWKWPTSVSCQCIIYGANCASQWWMNLPLLLNTMLAGSLSRTRAPDMNCQECKAVHRLLRWYSNFHVFFLIKVKIQQTKVTFQYEHVSNRHSWIQQVPLLVSISGVLWSYSFICTEWMMNEKIFVPFLISCFWIFHTLECFRSWSKTWKIAQVNIKSRF